jgi:hypothetical protein
VAKGATKPASSDRGDKIGKEEGNHIIHEEKGADIREEKGNLMIFTYFFTSNYLLIFCIQKNYDSNY